MWLFENSMSAFPLVNEKSTLPNGGPPFSVFEKVTGEVTSE
jgi:hypothetical protein